jgi:hypothetical protein
LASVGTDPVELFIEFTLDIYALGKLVGLLTFIEKMEPVEAEMVTSQLTVIEELRLNVGVNEAKVNTRDVPDEIEEKAAPVTVDN